MQFADTARGQDAVQGVKHQPGLGHFQQGAAERGVLAARVDQQGDAGQAKQQGHRQCEQQVDQDRQRRMQLAVALVVADILMQLLQLGEQPAAPPYQGADEQQQRNEQPGTVDQAGAQFAYSRAPGHRRQLPLQQFGDLLQPGQVEWLVAGDPEHLFFQRVAQARDHRLQLLLIELQGDRLVEQGIQLTVHVFEQLAAGGDQLQQSLAQLGGDLLGRLAGQQAIDIGIQVAELVALLIQLELVEADVGDFVGQAAVDLQARQGLFLLVEDLGQ